MAVNGDDDSLKEDWIAFVETTCSTVKTGEQIKTGFKDQMHKKSGKKTEKVPALDEVPGWLISIWWASIMGKLSIPKRYKMNIIISIEKITLGSVNWKKK